MIFLVPHTLTSTQSSTTAHHLWCMRLVGRTCVLMHYAVITIWVCYSEKARRDDKVTEGRLENISHWFFSSSLSSEPRYVRVTQSMKKLLKTCNHCCCPTQLQETTGSSNKAYWPRKLPSSSASSSVAFTDGAFREILWRCVGMTIFCIHIWNGVENQLQNRKSRKTLYRTGEVVMIWASGFISWLLGIGNITSHHREVLFSQKYRPCCCSFCCRSNWQRGSCFSFT